MMWVSARLSTPTCGLSSPESSVCTWKWDDLYLRLLLKPMLPAEMWLQGIHSRLCGTASGSAHLTRVATALSPSPQGGPFIAYIVSLRAQAQARTS